MDKIRVRYAPSPTGYLHIGGARSALFNYLFAKKYNGDFVLRIEDTDIERNIPGAEESQINDLMWLGIMPDEGPLNPNPKYAPYKQTEKLELYRSYAQKLIDMGVAYECYCSEDELVEMKENQLANGVKSFKYDRHCLHLTEEEKERYKKEGRKPSIRLKMESNVELAFDDLVRGPMKFNSNDIGDFVIIKSNGIPTYNFAVVIDDHIMEISHVLRGEEHLSNTPKQLQIYKYFGWEPPKFGHMTIIVNEKGKKLSKRDNNILQFMSQYKKLGYIPEAIVNFLLLLGFTPNENREIYNMQEAIEVFDPARLSASPSMFDCHKLAWMNQQYIKDMAEDKYLEFIMPFINETEVAKTLSEDQKKEFALIFKTELEVGSDIEARLNNIYAPEFNFSDEEKEFLELDSSKIVIAKFIEIVKNYEATKEGISKLFKEIQSETGIKGKNLYMPVRLKLTGLSHGIEMFHLIGLIGADECIARLGR